MAKIVYFLSPLDESKQKEIISKGTLRYALKEFGIEEEPLCVSINGMIPEEIDLDTILDDSDVVEVRRMVHGGGNADTKRTLATVVQVAALVAMTYLSGGATSPALLAAIGIGSAVAAGALNKWANDILAGQASKQEQDVDVETNSFSIRNAANKARPLAPIPVPIGSHRYAPDVHTDFYRTRYGWAGNSTVLDPYFTSFIPGIISSNGPMAPNNSWATMPANYMATGFPYYPIKIAPFGLTKKTTALTPSENTAVLNDLATSYENPIRTSFNFNRVGPSASTSAFPIIVYHFHPSDPNRGRFNLWWNHARVHQYFSTMWPNPADRYQRLTDQFTANMTTTNPSPLAYFTSGGGDNLTRILSPSVLASIPTTFSDLAPFSSLPTRLRDYLLALNGGTYNTTDKTTSPSTEYWMYDYGLIQAKEGFPISTQLFNYGFGDLSISQRRVGAVEVLSQTGNTVGYQPIDRDSPFPTTRWTVPNTGNANIGSISFFNEVQNFPPKQLINPDIYNGLVSTTDQNQYNFNFYEGKIGLDNFKFSVSGRLYQTSGSGFIQNVTRLQIQWRWSGEIDWRPYVNPIVTVQNSNTQNLYLTYILNNFTMGPSSTENLTTNYLQVRIRKLNLDSSDNESPRVSQLSIVDACFIPSSASMLENFFSFYNAPMNIEGLYTTALITDSSTTNQYSALIEAKCWVYNYDLDTWSWTFTRNPAFWFLFYARGGFLNFNSDGSYPTPYSPTKGWVNYPGHPSSTEHIFGGGYADEQIDLDKILEWGFFCQEQELYIDMIIKDDVSVAETLEKIANIGRASVSYYGGVLSVVIEDPNQVPVCAFGMANIIKDSFSVEYSVGDPIRKVIARFTNRENWESDTVESIVPFSSPETIKELEITLDGITDKENAQREVNILAARQFFQKRVYSWKTDIEGYQAKRGDLAYLSHDSTQYGFSGRVMDFVVEEILGVKTVIGIKTGSYIDQYISFVTLRNPAGDLNTYSCTLSDGYIKFSESYALEDASFYVNKIEENPDSYFPGSIPEDFTFISDVKQTTGKKVRISEITAEQNGEFSIIAVDEDEAMWAYEYGELEGTTSDSEVPLTLENVRYLDLGEGRIRILWDLGAAESVMIRNVTTNLPIEANGQYSFTGGEVVLDLQIGVRYDLEIIPLTYGAPFYPVTKRIDVWPL